MTYTLQIAASRHTGSQIYQILLGPKRSTWHFSIDSAWSGLTDFGTSSSDLENHHVKFTVEFSSLEELQDSYPELFI